MRRFPIRARALAACRIVVALAFVLPLSAFVSRANAEPPRTPAQSRQLYERGWQAQQEQRLQRRAPRAVKRSRRSETPPPDRDAEETRPVEKLDDARIVLVIGDFMASGLADALEDDYAETGSVRVVDATQGSSGLVRSDFYDWPAQIGPVMDSARPAVVVVMLGANDRQAMTVGTTREPPRSDAWTAEYVKRVTAVATAVTERKIPLVWVGQPAFKYASMSSDMLAFDDIYQRVVEAAGGEYVDIWDGFVDENGAFQLTGPDVNGQPVRLRSDDGIALSQAGKAKVAFYAEKPLSKILGGATSTGMGALPATGPGNGAAPSLDRTTPISLASPPVDDNADLLGSKPDPGPRIVRTPVERLTIEGVAPPSPPGRADDFGGADGEPSKRAAMPGALLPSSANTSPVGKRPAPEGTATR